MVGREVGSLMEIVNQRNFTKQQCGSEVIFEASIVRSKILFKDDFGIKVNVEKFLDKAFLRRFTLEFIHIRQFSSHSTKLTIIQFA